MPEAKIPAIKSPQSNFRVSEKQKIRPRREFSANVTRPDKTGPVEDRNVGSADPVGSTPKEVVILYCLRLTLPNPPGGDPRHLRKGMDFLMSL